jgi:hypothetical protein
VIVPGLEGTPCDDVHPDAQKILQILEQTDVIEEGRASSKSTSRTIPSILANWDFSNTRTSQVTRGG